MRIVAFSDSHMLHRELVAPDGDLLIFAGDACNWGSQKDIEDFGAWWRSLPHKHCGPYSDREQAIDWIASLAAAPPQGGEG